MDNCFNCGREGADFHGYSICGSCKSKLKLFTDETIKKYHTKDPEGFTKEIQRRMEFLDKDYIKKRLKLLHIQEQIKYLKQ